MLSAKNSIMIHTAPGLYLKSASWFFNELIWAKRLIFGSDLFVQVAYFSFSMLLVGSNFWFFVIGHKAIAWECYSHWNFGWWINFLARFVYVWKTRFPYNLSFSVRADFTHFAGIQTNLKMNFLILKSGGQKLYFFWELFNYMYIQVFTHGHNQKEYGILLHLGKRHLIPSEIIFYNIELFFFSTPGIIEKNNLVIGHFKIIGQNWTVITGLSCKHIDLSISSIFFGNHHPVFI